MSSTEASAGNTPSGRLPWHAVFLQLSSMASMWGVGVCCFGTPHAWAVEAALANLPHGGSRAITAGAQSRFHG
jgi:hypothetical protein